MIANNKTEEVEFYLPQRHVLNVKLGGKVSILRGNLVRFVCPIVEKANVDISWYMNSVEVFDGDMYNIEGRTLELKDSTEIGKFNVSCKVSGAIGSTSVSTKLVIVGESKLLCIKIVLEFLHLQFIHLYLSQLKHIIMVENAET